MGKEVINAPPGFRFKPRDDELITNYLKPKVTGQKLPCNIINDAQLYAPNATPWLMFDINDHDSWDDENSLYVFTSLSKVSTDPDYTCTKSRYNTSKRAGCGTWVQKTSRVQIKDGVGNVIGGRRMMAFQVNEIGDGFDFSKAVYFKMHEFSLWGVNEGLCYDGCDLVLCKISFDVSKKALFKVPAEKTDCVLESGGKAQKTKQGKKKNFEGGSSTSSVDVINMSGCDVLEGSRSLDSQSLVTVDDGAGNEDWSAAALKDLEDLLCFDDIGSEGLFKVPAKKTDCVLESAGNEGSSSSSVDVMNTSDVLQESVSLNCQSLVTMDGGVGNEDCSAAALKDLEDFLCFDDIGSEGLGGEEMSFDADVFMEYLNSTEEEELSVDRTIQSLGKRKSIERDNLCPAKKVCF